jgi:hypothetical protein
MSPRIFSRRDLRFILTDSNAPCSLTCKPMRFPPLHYAVRLRCQISRVSCLLQDGMGLEPGNDALRATVAAASQKIPPVFPPYRRCRISSYPDQTNKVSRCPSTSRSYTNLSAELSSGNSMSPQTISLVIFDTSLVP